MYFKTIDVNIEDLYHEFGGMVYNIALQYVQNKEDAEEITQDVFYSIYLNLDKYRSEANIKTWVYRITINRSLDFIKARNRKKRFAVINSIFTFGNEVNNFEAAHFNHPGVLMEQKEAVKAIFAGINQLPENQKTALILNKIEAMSQKEIAEIMQLSTKAVESLIQRAKSKLKNILMLNEGNFK